MRTFFVAALGLAAAAAVSPAAAQSPGTLTCNVSGSLGIIIGSSKDVNCLFTPVRGPQQAYAGTLSDLGLDIGATLPGTLTFAVAGAGPRTNLSGTYSALGLGISLLGGSTGGSTLAGSNGVSLKPVGPGPGTGPIGVSFGIGTLALRATPTLYRSGRVRAPVV